MKVTIEQLVNFIAKYGDKYDVTAKDVEQVGVEQVFAWVDGQYNPRAGTCMVPIEETDATQAMHDFFAESWGHLFDRWWSKF